MGSRTSPTLVVSAMELPPESEIGPHDVPQPPYASHQVDFDRIVDVCPRTGLFGLAPVAPQIDKQVLMGQGDAQLRRLNRPEDGLYCALHGRAGQAVPIHANRHVLVVPDIDEGFTDLVMTVGHHNDQE